MTRTLLISNAASGGSDEEIVQGILSVLQRHGPTTHVSPGSLDDFDQEVSAAAYGADRIVVAGGDGTLNCTINALAEGLDRVVFGVIPMGTGNDLARTFELPDDPAEALRVVLNGSDRPLDVCMAAGDGVERLFVNASIGGFPVRVSQRVDDRLKRVIGSSAYVLAALKEIPKLDRFKATVNGVTIEDCVAVGVGNGRTCGGGTRVWPDADPADGALDVCALSAVGLGELLKVGATVTSGKHVGQEHAFTSRGGAITIDAEPAVELNVDGELLGLKTPVTFSVVARTRIKAPSL